MLFGNIYEGVCDIRKKIEMRWINLGNCDERGCKETSTWFTIEGDDVDKQLCNKHFPPEKE